jgi:cysteinyl-tRNA synthetase
MSPLQLYNTRTRAKQTLVPADPSGQVGLFVCGPTVYDLPHLGHAKTYTQFDFLLRLLRTRGFAVTYVQNITDVDDKIIRRARELGIDASDLARRYERFPRRRKCDPPHCCCGVVPIAVTVSCRLPVSRSSNQ